MKKIIPAIGFAAATIGLLVTSGVFSGSVASYDDGFVDPVQYAEAPALDKVLKADDEEGTYDVDSVIIHYHNDDKKCTNRRFWLWVTGVDGAEYSADTTTQTDLNYS